MPFAGNHSSSKGLPLGALLVLGLLVPALGGCDRAALKRPTIAINLPDQYNTPDGMVVDPATGDIILSCPNSNDDKYPAKMLRIDANDKISEIITLPAHPETGKAGPLGVDVGPDGSLYICDNQAFGTEEHKSRLLRVVMKPGSAPTCEVLVTGFVMSNAVSCRGDSVYVTETKIDPKAYPLPSGVYRFRMSELSADKPIALQAGGKDKHLILTFTTKNKAWAVGANGLGFDAKGNMFICNFGDAQVIEVTFDAAGNVASQRVFAERSGMKSTDGLKVDPKTGDVYVADFLGNAVHRIDAITGMVTTIARNRNTDGSGGKLDRPSEVCLRGSKLYVSNIDLPLAGNTYDKPHTISVIDMSK
jgi:sugar lactone lactonase YvrE